MTIMTLDLINCTVVELLLQVVALIYDSYGEQHYITTPMFISNGNNQGNDNQGNASIQSQLVNAFISA
jgi:hypothetical protein